MTANLLLGIACGDVDINNFINWLTSSKNEYFVWQSQKWTRTDFVTFFLNFIHEELLSNEKITDQKTSTPKKSEQDKDFTNNDRLQKAFERDCIIKSTSFPLDKSLEKSLNNSKEDSFVTSPKLPKISSDSVLNTSYSSPLSPLYQQRIFSTPKNKGPGVTQNSAEKLSPLCLSDFIINTPTLKKKIRKSSNATVRRITPTSLNTETGNFRKTSNCFDNFNTKEIAHTSFSENRNDLVEEGLKVISKAQPPNESNLMVLSRKIEAMNSFNQETIASKMCVSHEKELNNLGKVYITILNHSLVLNVTSEIYFLISLIAKKNFDLKEEQSTDLYRNFDYLDNDIKIRQFYVKLCCDFFRTIHNIIYFAIKCLESQMHILKHLDKTTLMLLADNSRLKHFSKKFSEQIKRISQTKLERVLDISENYQTNVCFNLDTDNRNNFSSDITFHAFRKQRDLFYEILRIWENNHLQPGWSFVVGLRGKINSLLNLQNEPSNYMHICRLFKDQLLSTCGKYHKEDNITEDDFSLLSSLPNVDADKLNRLKNRLVNKQSSNGLNAPPVFTGYEEFYKEFISTAANYIFNRHLCDTLIADIIEINKTKFTTNDYEDSDVDVATKKSFISSLKYLKVLAKFLGYLESLPYRSECNYSAHFLHSRISVRQNVAPSLDIKQLLITAIEQKNVVLAVPWITEYLAILDFLTLRLPYYLSVHKLLFQLYRKPQGTSKHSSSNHLFVKFSLAWLFELSHFPDNDFFAHLNNLDDEDIYLDNKENKEKNLDDMEIVDQNILYIFCPYLEEIKKLLLTNTSNNNPRVKHITPVTTTYLGEEISKKKLEQQLEETFFSGQPVSVRKTVEFVSERVASTCVKYICYDIVPQFKKTALKETESLLKAGNEELSKEIVKTTLSEIVQTHVSALKEKCQKSASEIMKDKIPPCIESLLAIDTLPQTKTTCVAIAVRMCKESVKQWISSHINSTIFKKDLNLESLRKTKEDPRKILKNKPVFSLPSTGNNDKHNEEHLSAAVLLEILKNLSVDILDSPQNIQEEMVLNILKECCNTLNGRCDVNENINSYICMLLVDILLLLVVHRPDISKKEVVLTHFVKVLTKFYGKTEDLFNNLFCHRNVTLMSQANNDKIVWTSMGKMVAFLIKSGVISCDNVESQCVAFYQQEWEKVTLENMSTFLNSFVQFYKEYGGNADKFTYLLEFLSDYCIDL